MTWAEIKLLLRGIPIQTWIIGAVIAAGVFYHLHARADAYERGRTDARAEIERANIEARRKADDAANDVANCRGVWDRASGKCLPDKPAR